MTKEISLTRGLVTLIDDDDYALVSQWRWQCSDGGVYRTATANGVSRHVYLARLLTDCPAGLVVDHINGDRFDNRRRNLRICTQAENARNRRKARSRTGDPIPYKGVYPSHGRWYARICSDGKQHYLGMHDTAEAAARAHDAAALKYHGEFACLNFPPDPSMRRAA